MLDDPTFAWRAPLGVMALLALAVRDRSRTGRWDRARELAFLFGVTAAAMAYATAHDAVTWSISREYFAIGKDLPDAAFSFAPVARLALLAGWSAGLAVGLVLVVANNPRPPRPQLRYRVLIREAAVVAAVAAGTAAVGALIAVLGLQSFAPMLAEAGVRDPRAYLGAQGAHLGSYVGGLAALVVAWRRVRAVRERAGLPP